MPTNLCGLSPTAEPSFLDYYVYAAGTSKIPVQYHLWCGLALLSSTVANRIWFEKFKGERLYPNLYVMLLGPSGIGKNRAISRAQKRIEALGPVEQHRVQMYRGKITPQGLMNLLGDKKKRNRQSHLWLITPELAVAVGQGGKAWDWVTHMTELHDGNTSFQDMTRGSGHFEIKDLCLSWLSGSNMEWLFKSIPKEDIMGGFFARICPVPGERKIDRFARPLYPHDYEIVSNYLHEFLAALAWVEGSVTETPEAAELHDFWYNNRPEPVNRLMLPFWDHGDNRVYQLATLLAVSDNYRMHVTVEDMENAIALYEWLFAGLDLMLEATMQRNPESEKLNLVEEFVRTAYPESVSHSGLLRYATNRGIERGQFKSIVSTLIERKDINIAPGHMTNRRYIWLNGASLED